MRAAILILAALAAAAAPPAPLTPLTPAQAIRLRERSVLFDASVKAWKGGKQEEAITALEKALLIERGVFGAWHRHTEAALDSLGDLRRARGEWRQEAECRRAVLESRLRLDGVGHWRATDARLALEEALAQPKRTPAQRDALRRAATLTAEMMAFHRQGQSAKAIPLAKQALAIRKESLGERHPDYADSLNNLAFLHKGLGDHAAALPLYTQALAIRKEALGARHPSYANGLNNLALLHQAMGHHEAALPLLRQSLAINKATLGERHPSYAGSLNNLAALHQAMGGHKAALPLFQQSLAITRAALGERHPSYATGLNNLAALHAAMGDHEAALPLYKQALAIIKAARGERHPDHAASLNSLAGLLQEMGDLDAALPLLRKALALRKEALGVRHPDYAQSLNNLASLTQAMGDHEAALPLFKQALALHKAVLGERHPLYATGLNNLAALHRAMGDHAAALPLYQQALVILKAALGERHPGHAACLNNLAGLHASVGGREAALPFSEKALAITKENLRLASSVQSDRQLLAAAEGLRHFLDTRLSLMDAGAHAHALAWKALVLLRQRQRRLHAALSADPKTRNAAEELRQATRLIAALSASATPSRERLEGLTAEQERLQAELARLSADARAAFKEEPPTPEALSAALPDGAALADFHFYWRFLPKGEGGKPAWERHLVAFVSRNGKPTARVDLGPARQVEEAVRAWLPPLARKQSGLAPAAAVKALIWSPLEKHLAGAEVVLVSPEGPLGAMPFYALPGKAKGSYLIEDVVLAVVPVPQALPALLAPVAKGARLKPSLLLVGDVDYDAAEATPARPDADDRSAPIGTRREWAKLDATFAEVASAGKSFSGLFKGGSLIDLSKGDATKKAVREALPRVRYAHLATHGYFAPEGIKSALAPRESPALFGREGVTGWHPLLLSGIVLSGANREPKAGAEDGILTALEVSELDLSKLELAVLSACETGLGKVAGGEGLLGMQRAFQIAGARSVVASLWNVDDRATQALMSDFYRIAWDPKKVVGRAGALRQAQLSLLKEGRRRGIGPKAEKVEGEGTRLPPYYWAAFVLSGDWR